MSSLSSQPLPPRPPNGHPGPRHLGLVRVSRTGHSVPVPQPSPSPASRRAARSAAVGLRGARRVSVTGPSLCPRPPSSNLGAARLSSVSPLLHLLCLHLRHSSDLGAPCPLSPRQPRPPLPSFPVHFGLRCPPPPLGPLARGSDSGGRGSRPAGRVLAESPGVRHVSPSASSRRGTPAPGDRLPGICGLLGGLLQDQVWVLHRFCGNKFCLLR